MHNKNLNMLTIEIYIRNLVLLHIFVQNTHKHTETHAYSRTHTLCLQRELPIPQWLSLLLGGGGGRFC